MIKLMSQNSIYFIGKIKEIKEQLNLIEDKSLTVADYIKLQTLAYRKSIN